MGQAAKAKVGLRPRGYEFSDKLVSPDLPTEDQLPDPSICTCIHLQSAETRPSRRRGMSQLREKPPAYLSITTLCVSLSRSLSGYPVS
jgi:hypothetical protein